MCTVFPIVFSNIIIFQGTKLLLLMTRVRLVLLINYLLRALIE